MAKHIVQAVAFILALQVLPVAASIAGPYVMLVNRGLGWEPVETFYVLRDCEDVAARYAARHDVQAGCTPVLAFERWQRRVRAALGE